MGRPASAPPACHPQMVARRDAECAFYRAGLGGALPLPALAGGTRAASSVLGGGIRTTGRAHLYADGNRRLADGLLGAAGRQDLSTVDQARASGGGSVRSSAC